MFSECTQCWGPADGEREAGDEGAAGRQQVGHVACFQRGAFGPHRRVVDRDQLTDVVLILSGDHIYTMDYEPMISFHLDHQADATVGTIRVPIEEASRFGILGTDDKYRVTSFVEKPANPYP